jgi:creatinine amidohydrolase
LPESFWGDTPSAFAANQIDFANLSHRIFGCGILALFKWYLPIPLTEFEKFMALTLKSKFWADHTTLDFKRFAAAPNIADLVAVLPVAAIEQHGPHLPVSVDQTLVDSVIQASLPHMSHASAVGDLPVLILPTQAVGKSNEHIRFPGTLTLSAQTLISLWMDIGASVARAGIKKLVLFNSHGGQVSVMDIVARDLRSAHDLLVFSTNWYTLPLGDSVMGQFSQTEHRFGIHAGDMETSMMLATRAPFVDMHQARNFTTQAQDRQPQFPIAGNGVSAKMGWQIQDYNAMGAAGDASLATADKGRAVIESAGKQLALLLAEISRMPLTALVAKPGLPD